MKTLYAEDISKYTETKGCPSNVMSKFIDPETGIYDDERADAYFKQNPSERNKFIQEIWKYGWLPWHTSKSKEEMLNDPDIEGCFAVSEKNIPVDDKSMKLTIGSYEPKNKPRMYWNVYHKDDVQKIFQNNLLDDPNKIVKFLKIIFFAILTLLITAIIGSCYEFWLFYGTAKDCLYFKSDCDTPSGDGTLNLIQYFFRCDLYKYPYQKCKQSKSITTGGSSKFVTGEKYFKDKNCVEVDKDVIKELQQSRPFPYNIVDITSELPVEQLKVPIRAFVFGFLFTTLIIRWVLQNVFNFLCIGYNKVKTSSIARNIIFLFLTGLIFPILGYYMNVGSLAYGPLFILTPISGIISIIASFGIIISLYYVITRGHYISPSRDKIISENCSDELYKEIKAGYYKLFNLNKIFNLSGAVQSFSTGKILDGVLKLLGFLLNFFIFPFITIPISFITGVLGIILSSLYLNIAIPLKMFIIPIINKLQFFEIIKSHSELLTILFCISVIGASAESLDPVTTGIMSLILVIIIAFKVLKSVKNSF